MGSMSLPPGFRFHPTDDELVGYYLKRKVDGLSIELEVIPVIDLYKFDPWDLPEKSFLPKRDMEWFFFCPRDKKYPNGSRTNRATTSGYWKATGKDRKVFCESSVQGLRKTLVFYIGRAPGGARTDWVMHEYRLCENLSQATPNFLGAFALCRVVKRNEQGLKGAKSHVECKGKRSLPSFANDFSPRKSSTKTLTSTEVHSSQTRSLSAINNDSPPIDYSETHPVVAENNQTTGFWESPYLWDAPKDYSMEQSFLSEPTHLSQFPNISTESYPSSGISPVSSYASLTEETYLVDELNNQENFTSFPSPLHHTNAYSNDEDNMGIFQGLNWEMHPCTNAPLNGFEACNTMFNPLMCRQASDVEEASLWLQEDNLLVVM